MTAVDIDEVKAHLSGLIDRALGGEEIVISKGGQPVARLVPIGRPPRRPGQFKGRITVTAAFDEPLPQGMFPNRDK